jgi:D-glycero-alpha-D-manno-heptose-7-phosphate kinase
MIISRTPFRISFFGGGTDYNPWFEEHGGAVLSTSINRYCYLSCRHLPPFFEHKNRIVWSQIETVSHYDEIAHPVVREVMRNLRLQGLEIHHDGDLPSRAGLGSSSSFTVGLLNALHSLKGERKSKQQLAEEAIYVERELLRESVGIQDQIAAAFGGLNKIEISEDGSFKVRSLELSRDFLHELENSLMLFYSGISRFASEVAGDQIKAIPNKTRELHQMREMVDHAETILCAGKNLAEFGRLMHESWILKRGLSDKVSPAFIDQIYETALKAGAYGGKLLGAGGGGFLLFCVPKEKQRKVEEKLGNLLMVPIKFETSGSQIIFDDAEGGDR